MQSTYTRLMAKKEALEHDLRMSESAVMHGTKPALLPLEKLYQTHLKKQIADLDFAIDTHIMGMSWQAFEKEFLTDTHSFKK